MAENDVDLDSIIDRLLEVRGSRPGKQVQLLEAEIRFLCTKAREIFIAQPILLELEAPIKVLEQQSINLCTNPTIIAVSSDQVYTDLWRYPRPILRSPTAFRVRRLPP